MSPHAGKAWVFLRTLHKEFDNDNGAMVAAAMSFYTVLSVVPLLIVAIAILGHVLGGQQAYDRVFEHLGRLFAPGQAADIERLLQGIVRGRGTAGGVGLLVLLWAGSQTFVSLERAVNIAWNVRIRRGFVRQRLVAAAMVIAAAALLLVSLGLTTLTRLVMQTRVPVLRMYVADVRWAWDVMAVVPPLVITVVVFTLIYKFLPNRPVNIRHALAGGVVSGALWETAKHLFSWYVVEFAGYTAVYGSLASVILLMVWIYYSSIVMVIGAEVAAIAGGANE